MYPVEQPRRTVFSFLPRLLYLFSLLKSHARRGEALPCTRTAPGIFFSSARQRPSLRHITFFQPKRRNTTRTRTILVDNNTRTYDRFGNWRKSANTLRLRRTQTDLARRITVIVLSMREKDVKKHEAKIENRSGACIVQYSKKAVCIRDYFFIFFHTSVLFSRSGFLCTLWEG